MTDTRRLDLGPFALQGGLVLPEADLAYATYGALSPARDNAILVPTPYGAHHTDIDWMIGEGRVLDPSTHFVVVPNQLGNGLSTSPSTLPEPFAVGPAPRFTHLDNLHAQERLLGHLGIERLALAYGWSMGGQQVLHWGALRPDRVRAICAVCTSARTAPHNRVFLEGMKAILQAAPEWNGTRFVARPVRALRAFARMYAAWAMSQRFYREALWRGAGFASLEDWLVRSWEGNFLRRDANDLLSMLETWLASDISANPTHRGDLDAALGAITARTLVMPVTTDLYFRVADNALEVPKMPNAELRPIDSPWGHRAGNPALNPADQATLRDAVRELLG
ncbi:MAG: alpha/beta fold hydrolase [Paracoccaceae bacterium]